MTNLTWWLTYRCNGFSLNVYNTFSALGKGSAEAQEIAPLLFFPSILQGGHIDDKTILHIPLEQPLIGRIDVLHPDQFDIRYDIVLPTEIQHFLGFGNASDHGTGKALSP